MPRKPWMYVGDDASGVQMELRPGVTADRYSKPGEMLWRYMPLRRLQETIARRALFFTRLSTYIRDGSDVFEGSTPYPFANMIETAMAKRGELSAYKEQERLYGILKAQTVLVNCWHKRDHEAAWMWDKYGRGEPAIAIVSRLDSLIVGVPDDVTVGHVEYVNFESDPTFYANIFARAFMKQHTREDEREVRAVTQDSELIKSGWGTEIESDGFFLEVDLPKIIDSIVVRDRELVGTVKDFLLRNEIHVPVKPSILLDRARR